MPTAELRPYSQRMEMMAQKNAAVVWSAGNDTRKHPAFFGSLLKYVLIYSRERS
jgi:hypothetical protein